MPGVEAITWLEVRQKLPGSSFVENLFAREKNGILLFEYAGDPQDVFELRTVEDVFLLVIHRDRLSRDWKDLRWLAESIEAKGILEAPLNRVVKEFHYRTPTTFRVVARKEGQHNYRRLDIEQTALHTIHNAYAHKLKFKDEDAQIEIWVNVLGSQLLCGLRLTDREMRHRSYKVQHLPASLRPSVAAAMVFLTEPAEGDVFLEPMCGAGTIVSERIIAGPCKRLLAGDIAKPALEASRHNIPDASNTILARWDAARLPVADAAINKAAVNLPFGKKVGSARVIQQLYPNFFQEMSRVLSDQGLLVVLSSEYDLVRTSLRDTPDLKVDRGYSVSVLGQWGRIYIIRKQ
jgi:23S rRNA G2445 N2-methylase RlmL